MRKQQQQDSVTIDQFAEFIDKFTDRLNLIQVSLAGARGQISELDCKVDKYIERQRYERE